MRVAILGSSPNTERYSYKAMKMLIEYKHEVFLVNPRYEKIEEYSVEPSLEGLSSIDVVTVYISKKYSDSYLDSIIKLKPRKVIFNPGSENQWLIEQLQKNNIETEEACTLVLLRTNQFN